MSEAFAVGRTWTDRFRGGPAAVSALAIFVISFATLAGAWYFQYVVKLAPCPLCLEQRIPYYVIIPVSLLLGVAALVGMQRKLLAGGFAVLIVALICSVALGVYHAGVEWHFWQGPTDCSGPLTNLGAGGSLLEQLRNVHVVRCDEAAWRLFGISLAGYNVLISLMLMAVAAFGLFGRKHAS